MVEWNPRISQLKTLKIGNKNPQKLVNLITSSKWTRIKLIDINQHEIINKLLGFKRMKHPIPRRINKGEPRDLWLWPRWRWRRHRRRRSQSKHPEMSQFLFPQVALRKTKKKWGNKTKLLGFFSHVFLFPFVHSNLIWMFEFGYHFLAASVCCARRQMALSESSSI